LKEAKKIAKEAIDLSGKIVNQAKNRYEQSDAATKAKVKKVATISLISLIGLLGIKKIFKKKN